MRITLVHNPGAGDTARTEERLRRELAEAGHQVSRALGDKDLERGLEDPAELVVVAGGDGSVKRVALGLAGRGVPLAILPVGTANNIAKSFGIVGPVAELAAGWATARRRPLRVGAARSRWGAARFVESVGAGVFAELIDRGEAEVDENEAGLTGPAIDRALLLLERIVRERPARPRRLAIDGRDLSGEYLLVEAMNIPLIGPNVPLAQAADCADGLLDLVTVSERERGRLADYVRARLTGGGGALELPVHRGARVTMEASPTELHVDDDAWEAEQDGGAPAAELREGEVTIALDEAAVEVLVSS